MRVLCSSRQGCSGLHAAYLPPSAPCPSPLSSALNQVHLLGTPCCLYSTSYWLLTLFNLGLPVGKSLENRHHLCLIHWWAPRAWHDAWHSSQFGTSLSWLKTQHSENEDHGIQSHHSTANKWGNNGNRDFILGGSKITADGDCIHEIKRCMLLGRKAMTKLDSILKSRDITLLTKVRIVKAMVFPIVIYGCEGWTIKKAEHWRIHAFELWCWRRLLDSREIKPVNKRQVWLLSLLLGANFYTLGMSQVIGMCDPSNHI